MRRSEHLSRRSPWAAGRSFACVLAAALMTALCATDAWAHGGNFRSGKDEQTEDAGVVPGDLIRRGAVTTERPGWLASNWGLSGTVTTG